MYYIFSGAVQPMRVMAFFSTDRAVSASFSRASSKMCIRDRKWREHMKENPYKRLPPIERKPDGSLYRMTPAQRKHANALIRRECCCYEDGNCMLLDNGGEVICAYQVSLCAVI